MTTTVLTDEAAQLAVSVRAVTAEWALPAAGLSAADSTDFRQHWDAIDELGWTGILDDVDCTSLERLSASADLIDAAGSVVRELARAGIAAPLRQTLVARAAAHEPIASDAIVVDAHAVGVWAPIATVRVDPSGGVHAHTPDYGSTCDIAGRPIARFDSTTTGSAWTPLTVLAQFLLVQEIAGAAEGAIEECRAYVSSRVQFGRPLVKLPAVAQQLGQLTIAQLQLDEAVRVFGRRLRSDSPERIHFAATAARTLACDLAGEIATQTHQLHGALGITAEATLRHRTVLLWADQDEGVSGRSWGLDTVPTTEAELWAFTDPV